MYILHSSKKQDLVHNANMMSSLLVCAKSSIQVASHIQYGGPGYHCENNNIQAIFENCDLSATLNCTGVSNAYHLILLS